MFFATCEDVPGCCLDNKGCCGDDDILAQQEASLLWSEATGRDNRVREYARLYKAPGIDYICLLWSMQLVNLLVGLMSQPPKMLVLGVCVFAAAIPRCYHAAVKLGLRVT